MYLWRTIDQNGEALDILVQARRDKRAALKLMRKLLKKHGLLLYLWGRCVSMRLPLVGIFISTERRAISRGVA
jgi:hypothetical protein